MDKRRLRILITDIVQGIEESDWDEELIRADRAITRVMLVFVLLCVIFFAAALWQGNHNKEVAQIWNNSKYYISETCTPGTPTWKK